MPTGDKARRRVDNRSIMYAKEAAFELGVCTMTIYRMFRRKELQGFQASQRCISLYKDSVLARKKQMPSRAKQAVSFAQLTLGI